MKHIHCAGSDKRAATPAGDSTAAVSAAAATVTMVTQQRVDREERLDPNLF